MKVALRMSVSARSLKIPRIVCGAAWNNNNPIQAGGIWQWGRKQWNNQSSQPLSPVREARGDEEQRGAAPERREVRQAGVKAGSQQRRTIAGSVWLPFLINQVR